MNRIKKYISFFICMLLILGTASVSIPEKVLASTNRSLYGYGAMDTTKEIVIPKGAENLYAGDFVAVYDDGTYSGYLSTNTGVIYKSSKPSVAKVHSKTGKITARAIGTTTITVKVGDETVQFTLRVLTKSNLLKRIPTYCKEEAARLNSASKKFHSRAKNATRITTKNRYAILTAYKNYDYKSSMGSYTIEEYNEAIGADVYTYYIFSPGAMHAYALCDAIDTYSEKYNPFSTYSDETFKVTGITGKAKSKSISLTLAGKVTANQIFAGKYVYAADSKVKETTSFRFPLMVKDNSTGYRYAATATVKKGSTKATITLENATLKKGKSYTLLSQVAVPNGYYSYGTWLNSTMNTFTVK